MKQTLKGFFEKKEGEIVGIASTDSPDRDGEVIKQDGWDLSLFKKNPVILASHNYHEFPIGKATNIKVEDNKLVFKMVLSKATEKAREAAELIQEGILNAFSVGFIPREFDAEKQEIIKKAELLEISLVSVPANPQAIVTAKGMKDNGMSKDLIKSWLTDDELKEKVEEIEDVKKVDEKVIELKDVIKEIEETKKSIERFNELTIKYTSGIREDQEIGEKGEEGRNEMVATEKALKNAISALQNVRTQQKKGGVKK